MNIVLYSVFIFLNVLWGCAPKTDSSNTTENNHISNTAPVQNVTVLTSFDQLKKIYTASPDTLYVVNLWATWCKPCVAELPYFNNVAEKFKGQKVRFIFASMDFIDAIEKSLKPFLAKKPLNGTVYVLGDQDVNAWGAEIDKKWDGAIPVTIVVSNGRKDARLGSFKDESDLTYFIKQYL